jgi:hypothetical protein
VSLLTRRWTAPGAELQWCDMVAFEIVTFAVAAVGAGACATSYFRPSRVLSELGQTGDTWFDHQEDADVSQRPADDAVDEPISFRPLRPRLH